jgi:hypothetical protein
VKISLHLGIQRFPDLDFVVPEFLYGLPQIHFCKYERFGGNPA